MKAFTDKTNGEDYDFELFDQKGKGAGLIIPKEEPEKWEVYVYDFSDGWIQVEWSIKEQCFINVYNKEEKTSSCNEQIVKDLLTHVKKFPQYRLKWLNQVPEPLMDLWKEL